MRTILSALVLALLLSPSGWAKKPETLLQLVVKSAEGEPVPSASVIVRILKGKRHRKLGETYQLRTSQQGTALLPPLRQGYVLVQVHAEGFQTFGDKVVLNEPEQTLTITLKPPQSQFSVTK